jgi:hypothetical protein
MISESLSSKESNVTGVHPPSVAAATYGEAGVAIDRFDGTIIAQQLEEVTE